MLFCNCILKLTFPLLYKLCINWFIFTIKPHLKSYLFWWFWHIQCKPRFFLTSETGRWRPRFHLTVFGYFNLFLAQLFAYRLSAVSHSLSSRYCVCSAQVSLNWGLLMFAGFQCSCHADSLCSIHSSSTGWKLHPQAIWSEYKKCINLVSTVLKITEINVKRLRLQRTPGSQCWFTF